MLLKILLFSHTFTLFLLPLYIIRFSFFGIPFTLLEVSLLISVSLTVLYCIKNRVSLKLFKTFFDLPILFFLIAAFLSLFVTPDLRGGLGILKAYFVEPILFFYSLVFVGKLAKDFRFIFSGLIGAVVLVSGLGFFQQLTGQFIFAEHEWVQGRVSSFYNSANAVALIIGPVIPIIAILYFSTKKRAKKLLYLGFLLLLTVIMFLTKSKGGILTEVVVLGILIYGLFSFKFQILKKLWYLIPTLFIILSLVFFGYVYQLYNPSIQTYGSRIEDDTLQIRYATWFSTSQILSGEAVLGTGLNGFKYRYNDYKLLQFQEDFQYPHTLIFNFWTETGLLGLFSFVVLIIYAFYICLTLNSKGVNYLGLGLLGAFSAIVIHGLVDVPYFKNDLALQFWALVAIVQLVKELPKEHT